MKKALIISNHGSPEGVSYKEIRLFLKKFLSDKNVVKIPKPVLNYLILPLRHIFLKKHYEKILIEGKIPLNYYMDKLKEKLQFEIFDLKIEIGNLYGKPFLEEKVYDLVKKGFKEIHLFPLYPHKTPVTTDLFEKYFKELKEKYKFEGKVLPFYYKNENFLKGLITKTKTFLEKENIDHFLFTYHGLPLKMAKECNYENQCKELSEILAKELGFKNHTTSFQSRFGFLEWVKPYTMEETKSLASKGIKNLLVLSPSFAIDCLETLYEINILLRKIFLKKGGEKFIFVNSLNDSEEHIYFLKNFILKNLN